jgi:glycosyltransferase involved in cell wall biosynthesis
MTKTHSTPLISVLMPVYNNAAFLGQSIRSILDQTFEDFELIILDDGSTEPVWDVIDTFQDPRLVRLRHPTNVGLPGSLNHCLDAARGTYFARQDSDDVSLPTRFDSQVPLFRDGVGLVSCWGYTVNADGQRVPTSEDSYLFSRIRVSNEMIRGNIGMGNFVLGAASIFRREVFECIGYYDEALLLAEDYNYWIRLLQHFDVAIVRQELYERRRHDQNMRHWARLQRDFSFADLARERAKQFPEIKHRLHNWPDVPGRRPGTVLDSSQGCDGNLLFPRRRATDQDRHSREPAAAFHQGQEALHDAIVQRRRIPCRRGGVQARQEDYRGVLRAVEEVSGVTMAYDQEGVKADKETVASRSSDSPAAAATSSSEGTLEFASSPDGAEIELEGAFIGSTPRSKSVKPGEYRVVMKKRGFKDWERKVAVSASEALNVNAELEPN